MKKGLTYQPVGRVDKDIIIGTGGRGFAFEVGQIIHGVANDLPPLPCFFGSVLPRC